VRYEDYEGVGSQASPRLGIVYKPIEGITLKGSWGKSFKAPTFYDQYRTYQTFLLPISFFGTNPGPADRTVIYMLGGNPSLKPERATTWSATITLEPRVAPGLKIEASYFSIKYRDRVASPIASILGVLQNPIYQSLITYSPTTQQINALVGGAPFGLENFSGAPYDPAKVFAILNANIQNSANQDIHGVDLSAIYGFDAGDDHYDLSASASYLKSNRQLIEGLPTVQNAGIIFNPPNWRGQGGGTWTRGNASFSAFASYIGGTTDNRQTPFVDVGSFFSVDAVAQIKSSATSGLFKDVGFTLSVTNLFNRKPSAIRTSSTVDPAYDSTNYPTIGRFVSLSISKSL
jgi:outer membrane receptor protein involved in Fe transport